MNVSVLFARQDSIYKQLGCDVWDMERDARLFNGANPVVAHPPCRAWGRLRAFAKPRRGEKVLARIALEWVRRNGGVLEHPLASLLWPTEQLPEPGKSDLWGRTEVVDQFWFGHPARKRTLLYVCGVSVKDMPRMPLDIGQVQHAIRGRPKKGCVYRLKKTTKPEREHTPRAFAEWLCEVAERSRR